MNEFVDPFEGASSEEPKQEEPPEYNRAMRRAAEKEMRKGAKADEAEAKREAARIVDELGVGTEPHSQEEKQATVAKLKEAGFMTAADLLPPDPLETIPQEPPDDDTPPDDVLPAFLVRRNRYGPGVHSVLLANGTAVGVWLDQEHHELDGKQVVELLEAMGLEQDLAAQFGRFREMRIAGDKEIAAHPAVQKAVAEEQRRKAEKELVQAAFLEAHKKKQK